MDAVTYDNPAGRLHSLLQRLREVEQGTALIEAWKSVLEASDEEIPSLLAEVGGRDTLARRRRQKSVLPPL